MNFIDLMFSWVLNSLCWRYGRFHLQQLDGVDHLIIFSFYFLDAQTVVGLYEVDVSIFCFDLQTLHWFCWLISVLLVTFPRGAGRWSFPIKPHEVVECRDGDLCPLGGSRESQFLRIPARCLVVCSGFVWSFSASLELKKGIKWLTASPCGTKWYYKTDSVTWLQFFNSLNFLHDDHYYCFCV